MALRTAQKWEHQFVIAKTLFQSMEQFEDNDELIRSFSVGLRNPIIFDNFVTDAYHNLSYSLTDDLLVGTKTKDHLIGISNIVLYIFKKKIYKKWNTVEDFKTTLKALQVILVVPKSLNDKGTYRNWQFSLDKINESIFWNNKLKSEGIFNLMDENRNLVSVDDVWNEWYDMYKNYL